LLCVVQTSKVATIMAFASSEESHMPLFTSSTTDNVSKTSERVSSVVIMRNGPRSFAARGMKAASTSSFDFKQKLSEL
jgi:hypothetical protein